MKIYYITTGYNQLLVCNNVVDLLGLTNRV